MYCTNQIRTQELYIGFSSSSACCLALGPLIPKKVLNFKKFQPQWTGNLSLEEILKVETDVLHKSNYNSRTKHRSFFIQRLLSSSGSVDSEESPKLQKISTSVDRKFEFGRNFES